MAEYQKIITNGRKVFNGRFEQIIYDIVSHLKHAHHFCESISRAFMNEY